MLREVNLSEIFFKLSGKIDKLRETKDGLLGSCPFHAEKTPSFWIKEDGYFKCFGCQKGGSIKYLLKYFGCEEEEEKKKFKHSTELEFEFYTKVLKEINLICITNLWKEKNENIREILLQRGLDSVFSYKFQIGFAEDIVPTLLNKNYHLSLLKKLPFFQYHFGKLSFVLEKQITFPIFDLNGQIIAMSGKDTKEKKYLNIANNQFYSKAQSFYYINSTEIVNQEKIYVVEGYFDALSLAKNNFKAVALMGVSFSDFHLQYLHNKKVVLALDNDDAGILCALKLSKILPDADFIDLEEFKDIDELLQKKTDFREINKKAYLEKVIKRFVLEDILEYLNDGEIVKYFQINKYKIEVLEKFGNTNPVIYLLKKQVHFEKEIQRIIANEYMGDDFGKPLSVFSEINLNQCFLLKDMVVSENLFSDNYFLWNLEWIRFTQTMLYMKILEEKLIENINEYLEMKRKAMQIKRRLSIEENE